MQTTLNSKQCLVLSTEPLGQARLSFVLCSSVVGYNVFQVDSDFYARQRPSKHLCFQFLRCFAVRYSSTCFFSLGYRSKFVEFLIHHVFLFIGKRLLAKTARRKKLLKEKVKNKHLRRLSLQCNL